MQPVPQITFVVPVRNNRGIIGGTLRSIRAQTIQNLACLVIDGGSTDGTVDFVRKDFPWAQVVCKPTDSGPAASRSLGLRASQSPFTALIDSDVSLHPAWAEEQLKLMRQSERVGIAGSRLLYAKNPEILCAMYGAMNRYGVAWDGAQGESAITHAELRRCIWANTSAILVRQELVERSSGFDDIMFAFGEDSDFGWRANISGFDVVCNPSAIAFHDVHGTFSLGKQDTTIFYLLRRNRIRALLVNYQLHSLIRYGSFYLVLSLAEIVVHRQRRRLAQAIGWNLLHLPGTLRRRSEVQRLRARSDAELWPLFAQGIRGPGGDVMLRLEKPVSAGSSLPETAA